MKTIGGNAMALQQSEALIFTGCCSPPTCSPSGCTTQGTANFTFNLVATPAPLSGNPVSTVTISVNSGDCP